MTNRLIFLYLFGLLMVLSSCAKEKTSLITSYVSDTQYAKEFEQAKNEIKDSSGVNLDLSQLIVVSMEMPNTVATCNQISRDPSSQKIITVSPSLFKPMEINQKISIIIHELGHCYFGLGHLENTKPGDVPDFMVPKISEALVYFYFNSIEKRAPYIKSMVQRSN